MVIQGFFNFALLRWLFANIEKGTRWVTCWVSDIPEERELYHVDPLTVRAAPLGYLASIERQMVSTLRRGTDYPVDAIVFVPLADRIVNSEGSVAFGERICATRGTGSSLVTYSDFWCHELLRSSKKSVVLDTLYAWIEAR